MTHDINQLGHDGDDSTVRVAGALDALAARERSLPNAAFESRVADTSLQHLVQARAQRQGLKVVGEPAPSEGWRFSAGFRLAAGLALAAIVGAAMLGRGKPGPAPERLIVATDAEWALVFGDSDTDALFAETEQLGNSIRTWDLDDTLSNEGAM